MEPTSGPLVFQKIRETHIMNRSVALRAFAMFTVITALATFAGISSQAAVAEAIFSISALLALIMLGLAFVPQPKPIAIKVRSRR